KPRDEMATGVRVAITLACTECKRRNYQTNKSKRNNPDRVEFKKYCRWCGHHTPHRETRQSEHGGQADPSAAPRAARAAAARNGTRRCVAAGSAPARAP